MSEWPRIVFDEDGYPRELIDFEDMKRAIDRDELQPDMTVIVYRRDSLPSSQLASTIEELRPLFGLAREAPEVDAARSEPPLNLAGAEVPAEVPSLPPPLRPVAITVPNDPIQSMALTRVARALPSVPVPTSQAGLDHPIDRPEPTVVKPVENSEGVPFINHFTSHYGTINGRETRTQYFSFVCATFIMIIFSFLNSNTLGTLVAIALILPSWCAAVRRLHDSGVSGWLLLISLVPYVGALIVLLLLFLPSSSDEKYGPVITIST